MGSISQSNSVVYTYTVEHYAEAIEDMETPLNEVEKILNYRFKNKNLLVEALTHPSCTDAPNYQRLEFLGDAALGLAVTNYIYWAYPKLDQGKLSLLRAANVSTEKLARVAVRHGLYRYVRHNAEAFYDRVRDFVLVAQDEDETEVYGGVVKAPKVLADIVESVAAAVYIDCRHDLGALWEVYRGILEPIVTVDDLDQQPQPVTMLFEMCQKEGKKVDIKHWRKEGKNITSVFVDGVFVASGSSENRENAKLHAAKLALEKLSYQVSHKVMNIDLDLVMDGDSEIQEAKQKLHEICCKRKWPKPSFSINKQSGPSHKRTFVCAAEVETFDKVFVAHGNEKSKLKYAENSAASNMLCGLRDHNLI